MQAVCYRVKDETEDTVVEDIKESGKCLSKSQTMVDTGGPGYRVWAYFSIWRILNLKWSLNMQFFSSQFVKFTKIQVSRIK